MKFLFAIVFSNGYLDLIHPLSLLFSNLQDPAEADKLLKIQRELDETKIILVSVGFKYASLIFQNYALVLNILFFFFCLFNPNLPYT